MRLRVLALPVVALLAMTSVAAAHTGPEPQMSFPQFERCLRDNGLTTVPDQQASMPVQLCKTVKVTRVTVYGWGLTIDPTPASPQIAPTQTVPVTYAFGATAAPTVSWIVDGIVVVRNMGAEDATITGVQDLLRLPDGSTRAQTLSDEPFTLMSPQSEECVEPPERVLRYSFTVQGPAVPQLPASGMNVATVNWQAAQPAAAPAAQPAARLQAVSGATLPGSESPTATAAVSVVFSEGRALNEAVYFRNANLTQSFDPAPAGIATGPPDNPGPFPLAADQPPTLGRSMTVPITNTALSCGSTATVTGVGVVQSPSVPELVGSPSLPALVPLPVNISSRSLVTVLSPACTLAGGTQPPVTGAGAAAPNVRPAGVPAKPGAPRATPCPRPKLSASLVGPVRTLPNGRASWVITVRNRGRAAARQVVLREWLPPGFAFVGASRAVSSHGRVLRFSARRLAAGEKLAIRLRLQAGATAVGGRQLLHVSAACGGVARAQARVRVAPLIAPAVTG